MLNRDLLRRSAALISMLALLWPNASLLAQSTQPAGSSGSATQGTFTMKVNTDIVLVSVTARDKQGNLIRDLKQSDFTLQEDGKTQQLRSFDVEDAQTFAKRGPDQAESQGAVPTQVMAAQTDLVDVLGRFDPKLVKMCPAGDRAED